MAAFTLVSDEYVCAAWRDKGLRAKFQEETGMEPLAIKERALEEQISLGYYDAYRAAFREWLAK